MTTEQFKLNPELVSREKIERDHGGLPAMADVDKQLRNVTTKVTVSLNSGRVFLIHEQQGRKFFPDLYKQFREEFAEDLEGFALRIQRVKVKILCHYLAGAEEGLQKSGGGLGYKDVQDKIPTRYDMYYHEGPFNNEELEQVVNEVNKLVPEEYRFLMREMLTAHDLILFNDLIDNMRYGKSATQEEKNKLESLLGEILDIEKTLFEMRNQLEIFTSAGGSFVHEEKYKSLWSRYRTLLKRVASEEQLSSWVSPSYGASHLGQSGKGQHAVPFLSDYQRNYMPELARLEEEFGPSYFRGERRGEIIKSYLFNNGMNALNTILEALDIDIEEMRRYGMGKKVQIFQTRDTYFEVDNMIRDHFSQEPLRKFDSADTDTLINAIKKQLPLAVFLSPVANAYQMGVVEITKILESLATDRKWKKLLFDRLRLDHKEGGLTRSIYLIIDNTTLGRLARWKEFDFSRLPQHIKIISFESLLKYAQDGQELTQAGLVTAIGEYAASNIENIRRRRGFTPPEDVVRKLALAVPQDLTDKKMERHSRNAAYVAEELQKIIDAKENGFIAEIIYPGSRSHPQYKGSLQEARGGGGLMNIGFNWNLIKKISDSSAAPGKFHDTARAVAKGFNELIIMLAQRAGVEINSGTSFGFNTTRMAVYEQPVDIPYLRVAVGTENIKDIYLIVEIIKRANDIFTKALRDNKLNELAEVLIRHDSQKIAFAGKTQGN